MPRTLTASDRSALIRLASTMEKGSPERRIILSSFDYGTGKGWPAESIGTFVRELQEDSMRDFVRVVESASNENVFALLVESVNESGDTEYSVYVVDRKGRMPYFDINTRRGKNTDIRPYVDAHKNR